MSGELEPCPFCGGEPYFERRGTPRHSCIVVCGECGARHESGDEGLRSGTSWNRRTLPEDVRAEADRLAEELRAHPHVNSYFAGVVRDAAALLRGGGGEMMFLRWLKWFVWDSRRCEHEAGPWSMFNFGMEQVRHCSKCGKFLEMR